jgi:predicted ATPase with chaperone activity
MVAQLPQRWRYWKRISGPLMDRFVSLAGGSGRNYCQM